MGKNISILMEKQEISNGIYLFIPKKIIYDVTNDIEEGKFVTSDGMKLYTMDNPYFAISDEKMCLGYLINITRLKHIIASNKDIDINNISSKDINNYYDNISKSSINIGVYNEKTDEYKVFTHDSCISKSDGFNSMHFFPYNKAPYNLIINILPNSYLTAILNLLRENKTDKAIASLGKVLENNDIILNKFEAYVSENNANKERQNRQKELEEVFHKRSYEEILDLTKEEIDKLNHMVGIDNIKYEVDKLLKYLIFINKVEDDLLLDRPNLNMFFSGNPGTGKTTVARIIVKLLYIMGYVKKDKVLEITAKDLIAGYVGQTAIKTANVINSNKSGVIFIDEAYVLSSDAQQFAQEALVEILKEMEKHQTVFIFAGYKDEMHNFLELNPGLASRIGYYLDFKDYTEEELYEILERKVNDSNMSIDDLAKDSLYKIISIAKEKKNFGNGRFIDNLFQKLLFEHAINTFNSQDITNLSTITQEDTYNIKDNLFTEDKQKKIGFK